MKGGNEASRSGSSGTIQQEVDAFRSTDPDLQEEAIPGVAAKSLVGALEKTSISAATTKPHPFKFVPLKMGGGGGTHLVSKESASLIEQEVTLDDLGRMTGLFYDKAFQDVTLDMFIRSHDDPHGSRFAKFIHQKLSGSSVWDHDRQTRDLTPVTVAQGSQHVVHDRSSAHAAAWYSPKRPSRDVGRHFKLDDCRVWMRLHFWALRESGLMLKSPSFADYYVRFIGHFVRVYESTAPMFARDSLRWSEDPDNIARYLNADGRRMTEVLNLSFEQAKRQIPEHEANDSVWPYNKVDPQQE